MQSGGLISYETFKQIQEGINCCHYDAYLRNCHQCPYNDWATTWKCMDNLQKDLKKFLNNWKGEIKIDGNSI